MKSLLLSIFVFANCFVFAQDQQQLTPPSITDESDVLTTTVSLAKLEDETKNYVAKYYEGITGDGESHFVIQDLGWIVRPSMVQVIAEKAPVTVKFVKPSWDDVMKEGKTKNGTYTASFKTAREYGIIVDAEEPGTPYTIVISAGKEIFKHSAVFYDAASKKSKKKAKKKNKKQVEGENSEEKGGGMNLLTIIIGAGLLLIIALLVALLLKKKKSASIIILLVGSYWGLQSFQSMNNAVQEISTEALGTPSQVLVRAAQGLANFYGRGGFDNSPLLSPDDASYQPNLDPRGQPSLPSSCFEASDDVRDPDYESDDDGGRENNDSDGDDNDDEYNDDNEYNDDDYEEGENEEGEYEDNKYKFNPDADPKDGSYKPPVEGRRPATKPDADKLEGWQEDTPRNNDSDIEIVDDRDYRIPDDDIPTSEQPDRKLPGQKPKPADPNDEPGRKLPGQKPKPADPNDEPGRKLPGQKPKPADPNDEPGRKLPDQEPKPKDDINGQNHTEPAMITAGMISFRQGSIHNLALLQIQSRENTNAGCDCLEQAYRDFYRNRELFATLHNIGTNTKKDVDWAISFGDNVSGVHAVSGIAWQTERKKILDSMKDFDRSYKNKYNQFVDELYDILMEIDRCEEMLDNPNWYSQAGFMYYEFTKLRYEKY